MDPKLKEATLVALLAYQRGKADAPLGDSHKSYHPLYLRVYALGRRCRKKEPSHETFGCRCSRCQLISMVVEWYKFTCCLPQQTPQMKQDVESILSNPI